MMSDSLSILVYCFAIIFISGISAKIVEHTFIVEGVPMERLCKKITVTTVNGSIPGPTIYAQEGDSLIVHVINNSPYNMTIHWHGIRQYRNCWADGTESISQCPITPSNKFTYKFNITDQEGTFWWHAHSGFQRTTVYGALIVYPKDGHSYPFNNPYEDVPIILGEWYDENVVKIEEQLLFTGSGPNTSDAMTINGWPGHLYSCSPNGRRILKDPKMLQNSDLELTFGSGIFKLKVVPQKTYLLRIINAALCTNNFFKIANHNLTVVAADGIYTNPYYTDLVALAPGQTIDVLLTTNQESGKYYLASLLYRASSVSMVFRSNYIPATGIMEYIDLDGVQSLPKMPKLPNIYDSIKAFDFFGNLTGLVSGRFYAPVPKNIDENMFITLGLGLLPCEDENDLASCQAPLNQRIGASMNNVSFLMPTKTSLLEAFVNRVSGIYTTDFPDQPPTKFDYVNESFKLDTNLVFTERSTKVKQFKFNASVEIVFQTHSLVAVELHPMHIHGHNVYVLGQGFGNYDPLKDRSNLNLVNPSMRNTIYVPIGGWIVIRFRADNPGAWYVHCHIEGHVPIGLAGAFLVENGPTPSTTLLPPPPNFPVC